MERPRPNPERSKETNAALRTHIGSVVHLMEQRHITMFEETVPTPISHGAVFPTKICDGKMSITFVDPLVEFAFLQCESECVNKTVMVNEKGEKGIKVDRDFMIDFDKIDLDSDFIEQLDPIELMIPKLPKGMTSQEFHEIEDNITTAFESGGMWFPTDEDPEGKDYPTI